MKAYSIEYSKISPRATSSLWSVSNCGSKTRDIPEFLGSRPMIKNSPLHQRNHVDRAFSSGKT